jgi:hypothetical protein
LIVQQVKKGFILQLADSGRNSVIQALEDTRFSGKNGDQASWCEFEAVDLVSGEKFTVGAANPPAPYAPGLTQVGIAVPFK